MLRHPRAITAVVWGVLSLVFATGSHTGVTAQQGSTIAGTVAEAVKKLGVDLAGLPADLIDRRFLGGPPELATVGLVGFAGWLAPATVRDPEVLLVAIRRPGELWKTTALPAEGSSAITQLGSPMSLASVGAHVVLSTHLNPSAGTTVVLRASDLSEVGRFAGGVAFTIPPSLVVFGRSMVHFAPAHPGSLGVFDLTSGVEAPLYPAVSTPYSQDPEESMTPARKAFKDRLRPIYLAWEKAAGPRGYGYDPAWFEISHTAFRYDQAADRLTFTETMSSNHPASVAPPLRHQVMIECGPMLKSSRVCVEHP